MTNKEEKSKSASSGKTSKKVDGLVDQISELSVLELSELVSVLQEKLGVSAAVPMATPQAAGSGAPAETAPPETGTVEGGGGVQTVVMTNAGANKISVIKAIREINQNVPLQEAKAMTENVPAEILKDAKAEDAKAASEKLKAAGASVELK